MSKSTISHKRSAVTPQAIARLLGFVAIGSICVWAGECLAMVYFVAPQGDDGASGTQERPFATIHKAAEIAQAGDEVVVRGGTYRITREIRPRHSGTPERWIVYRAMPGEKAVIDADGFTKTGPQGVPPSRRQLGALHLENVSYVRVENLTVRNAHFVCFNVMGPKTHHIDIIGCHADRSYGPGIFLRSGPEYCRVIGCEVTGANDPELRTSVERRPREAPHEAISIAWARHFEIAENHVHDCVKEGIDCKETSAHGVIHHNVVHDVKRQGLYIDCWFGLLEDVEFHSNRSYNNEWGLVLSAEGAGSRMENVRIHHNLLYNNRGSGVYFGTWGVNGPRCDIYIYNNTVFHNGSVKHWAGGTGGVDVRGQDLRRVFIVNNIVFDNAAYEIATFASPEQRDKVLKDKQIVIANNLTGPFHDLSNEGGAYNRPYAYRGEQTLEADPLFVNAKTADFRLQPGSPAIDGAKKLIPFDSGPDLGALSARHQRQPDRLFPTHILAFCDGLGVASTSFLLSAAASSTVRVRGGCPG